jgi:hypothetical protein
MLHYPAVTLILGQGPGWNTSLPPQLASDIWLSTCQETAVHPRPWALSSIKHRIVKISTLSDPFCPGEFHRSVCGVQVPEAL